MIIQEDSFVRAEGLLAVVHTGNSLESLVFDLSFKSPLCRKDIILFYAMDCGVSSNNIEVIESNGSFMVYRK